MARVTLLLGKDRGRARNLLRKIVEEAGGDFHSPDLLRFDGRTATLKEAEEALRHVSWTGGRRIVILWDFPLVDGVSDLDRLAGWVRGPKDKGPWLIIWAPEADRRLRAVKMLEAAKDVWDVGPLDKRAAQKTVQILAEDLGGAIAPAAAQQLIEWVGTDLDRLEQEVRKLLSLTDGRPVVPEDVSLAATGKRDLSVFRWTEAVGERRLAVALSLVGPLLGAGESAVGLVALLAREFRLLAKAKTAGVKGEPLGRHLGVPEFVARRLERAQGIWQEEEIARAFPRLLEADRRLKSGGRPDVTLELLVIDLVEGASSTEKGQRGAKRTPLGVPLLSRPST